MRTETHIHTHTKHAAVSNRNLMHVCRANMHTHTAKKKQIHTLGGSKTVSVCVCENTKPFALRLALISISAKTEEEGGWRGAGVGVTPKQLTHEKRRGRRE